MNSLKSGFAGASKLVDTDDRSLIERSVSFLLLALIAIFALNSIGNVQKYVGQYHEHWTGQALGIAFGTVVFVCAYIAATTTASARWVAIAIGTVFGVASANFQTQLYVSEGMQINTARALSYIPILAGEVGLALLESLYSKQHKAGQMQAVVDVEIRQQQETITVLKQQVEQQQARIETLSQDAVAQVAVAPERTNVAASRGQHNQTRVRRDHELNGSRLAQKQQCKAVIPLLLSDAAEGFSTGEIAQRLEADHDLRVSVDSVRRYCQELSDGEVLESRKRRWYLRTA